MTTLADRAGVLIAVALIAALWITAVLVKGHRDRQAARRGWAGHGGDIDQASHQWPEVVHDPREEET
jgi:hypothetical protein